MAQQVQPADVLLFRAATNIPAPDDNSTSIGGAISGSQVTTATGDILNEITVDKTTSKTRYTKVFIKNNHATLTLTSLSIYLSSTEPVEHSWELGKENTPNDTTIQGTAPSGVAFVAQDSTIAGRVELGNLAPLASVGIWLKLILTPNAPTLTDSLWNFKMEWI